MNKAYREDVTPKNVVCVVHTYPETFQTVYYVHFVKLPKVKYFDGQTWLLTSIENENGLDEEKNMFAAFLSKREDAMLGSTISFSDLPENFQKFVMRYYEDTFGAPGA